MAMNIWPRGRSTAILMRGTKFRVARSREVVRHATIVGIIGQTRQIVNHDPERTRFAASR